MASLTGSSVATTYNQLLTLPSGGGDTTTLVALTDGDGVNTFCLQLATTKALIEGNGSTLYFYDEGGESISADNAGVLSIAGGAEIDITAPTVDINASTAVTVDGPAVTIADGTGSKPLIIVKNTANDTTGSELRFVMDKGSAGADGDDLGTISFYGDDAGQNQTAFAKIVAEVSEADETDEAGKLSFYVAESDGTDTALTAGLILEGEHATDGEIDVTIGAGASSTTTIAGDLVVTGSAPSPFASGDTNNYVCTSNGSGQLVGESNLTYDGTTFEVNDKFAIGSKKQFNEVAYGTGESWSNDSWNTITTTSGAGHWMVYTHGRDGTHQLVAFFYACDAGGGSRDTYRLFSEISSGHRWNGANIEVKQDTGGTVVVDWVCYQLNKE